MTDPTCATCAHYDLVVIPPASWPVAQCWSPDDEVVGAWYWYQSIFGDGTLVQGCAGYQPVKKACSRCRY